MSSQRRVSGTAVQRTIAVLGSAVFFVVAPFTLAGLVPWWITGNAYILQTHKSKPSGCMPHGK
jgi:hypothetical protein